MKPRQVKISLAQDQSVGSCLGPKRPQAPHVMRGELNRMVASALLALSLP